MHPTYATKLWRCSLQKGYIMSTHDPSCFFLRPPQRPQAPTNNGGRLQRGWNYVIKCGKFFIQGWGSSAHIHTVYVELAVFYSISY